MCSAVTKRMLSPIPYHRSGPNSSREQPAVCMIAYALSVPCLNAYACLDYALNQLPAWMTPLQVLACAKQGHEAAVIACLLYHVQRTMWPPLHDGGMFVHITFARTVPPMLSTQPACRGSAAHPPLVMVFMCAYLLARFVTPEF